MSSYLVIVEERPLVYFSTFEEASEHARQLSAAIGKRASVAIVLNQFNTDDVQTLVVRTGKAA